jgi:hypothetical protein
VSLPDDPTLERPDDPKDTARLKAVLVAVATIAFVVTPFLADPFTGFDPDLLPVPVDDPMIQPAGWAFAIWGVIYLWLLVSAGYGLFTRDVDPDWDRLRWPLFISVGIGASWISVALIAPVMATVLIWVMLGGALLALARAPSRDWPWLALPLGLYAGWLTAASSVALATVAAGYGIGGVATLSWVGLALALVIALAISWLLRVPTYPFAVAWALAGIVAANLSAAPAFAVVAAGGALVMLWLTLQALRPAT